MCAAWSQPGTDSVGGAVRAGHLPGSVAHLRAVLADDAEGGGADFLSDALDSFKVLYALIGAAGVSSSATPPAGVP